MPRVYSSALRAVDLIGRGAPLTIDFAAPRRAWYPPLLTVRASKLLIAPTGGAMDISLSFKMTIWRLSVAPALFIAS